MEKGKSLSHKIKHAYRSMFYLQPLTSPPSPHTHTRTLFTLSLTGLLSKCAASCERTHSAEYEDLFLSESVPLNWLYDVGQRLSVFATKGKQFFGCNK